MANQIYHFSVWAAGLSNAAMVLLSLFFCFRAYNPIYVKVFPVYLAASLTAEILANAYPQAKLDAYNIFTVVELLYYLWFLITVLKSNKIKMLIILLGGIFMASFSRHLLLFKRVDYPSAGPVQFECIILLTGCFSYLWELFASDGSQELRTLPSFWMIIGMLFYFIVLPPTIWISRYYIVAGNPTMSNLAYSVNNYAQIISYIIFLKAITCRQKIKPY